MADDFRYEPITSGRIKTAEEMAREIEARAKRKEEEDQRKAAVLEEARQQAIKREDRERKYSGQKSHPRAKRPKEITVDGVSKPIDQALAEVPAQMDFENMVLASPLRERALSRARTEDLIAEGKSPAEAAAQARKEREGRQAAFEKGRESVRRAPNNTEKEAVTFAEDFSTSLARPVARALGFGQMADESEARVAGAQAEMAQHRQETYAHPEIAGAAAGAINSTSQMGAGVAGSMIAGPTVG